MMNVRITPRDRPSATVLYGGVTRLVSDGTTLFLECRGQTHWLRDRALAAGDFRVGLLSPLGYLIVDHFAWPLADVAAIALDDDPGDFF